ncbi:hypothetical protein VNO77_18563 [Canavalia gladiata]|uniref:Uncharacterized protein n=1 Tax=Canavalia gladiata TaxID=3824 RepID=A0AAN9QJS2_CANGL
MILPLTPKNPSGIRMSSPKIGFYNGWGKLSGCQCHTQAHANLHYKSMSPISYMNINHNVFVRDFIEQLLCMFKIGANKACVLVNKLCGEGFAKVK